MDPVVAVHKKVPKMSDSRCDHADEDRESHLSDSKIVEMGPLLLKAAT
jgi:hypothetical protein